MAAAVTPLEKAILLAMKRNGITASDLAVMVGMAPTNFSLARNNHRGFPLAALLGVCDLAGIDSDGKLKVIEWIAFEQVVDVQVRKVAVKKKS
jgi:hypothetical protein